MLATTLAVAVARVGFPPLITSPSQGDTFAIGSSVPLKFRTASDLDGATLRISGPSGSFDDTAIFAGFDHYDKRGSIAGCYNAKYCTEKQFYGHVPYWSAVQTSSGNIATNDPCSKAIQFAVQDFYPGTDQFSIDGWFGSQSEAAVMEFQKDVNDRHIDHLWEQAKAQKEAAQAILNSASATLAQKAAAQTAYDTAHDESIRIALLGGCNRHCIKENAYRNDFPNCNIAYDGDCIYNGDTCNYCDTACDQCAPNCCTEEGLIFVDGIVGPQTWPRIIERIEEYHCAYDEISVGDNDMLGEMSESDWHLIAGPAHPVFHYSQEYVVQLPLAPLPDGTVSADEANAPTEESSSDPWALPAGAYTGTLIAKDGQSSSFEFTVVPASCNTCEADFRSCMTSAESLPEAARAAEQCKCFTAEETCLRLYECGDARVQTALQAFNAETGCPNKDVYSESAQCHFCNPVEGGCYPVALTGVCREVLGDTAYVTVRNGEPQIGDLEIVDRDVCNSYEKFSGMLNPKLLQNPDTPQECLRRETDRFLFWTWSNDDDDNGRPCPNCQIEVKRVNGDQEVRRGECIVEPDNCQDAWKRIRCAAPRNTEFCSPFTFGAEGTATGGDGSRIAIAPIKPDTRMCENFRRSCAPNFLTQEVLGRFMDPEDSCTYVPYFEGSCSGSPWAAKEDVVHMTNFSRSGLLPDPNTCESKGWGKDADCCDAWADKEWYVDDDDSTGPGTIPYQYQTTVSKLSCRDVSDEIKYGTYEANKHNLETVGKMCSVASLRAEPDRVATWRPSYRYGPDGCCKNWDIDDDDHPDFPNALPGCRRAYYRHFDLSYDETANTQLFLRASAGTAVPSIVAVVVAVAAAFA